MAGSKAQAISIDMASQANDHHSSNPTPHPTVPALLSTLKTASRSNDQARLNRLNMEKMIMKNVAAARNSTKNRAQQILEALKRKRQQQDDMMSTNADEVERGAKRKKTAPAHSDKVAKSAVAEGILSPARRATGPSFASPTQRQNPPLHPKSPTPLMASPAQAKKVNALHLSSPMRPPRSSVTASPARPTRNRHTASPLRRNEFLTSPLRHRVSASPKRPLVFDDNKSSDAAASSTRINGHPPLLFSALDQVEVAPAAQAAKAVRASKSPFQSFQAKFNRSPAKSYEMKNSPKASGDLIQVKAPRSGPLMVDLTPSVNSSAQRFAPGIAASFDSTTPLITSSDGISALDSDSSTLAAPSKADDASVLSINPLAPPQKAVCKLFPPTRQVIAQRSICFSTENVATAVDATPDGEFIVVGFMDGSVRLYEMDSSIPSDRYGYLLGHLDEQSSQGSGNVHMRVKISSDGRYIFAGDRQRKRVVMSINLDHYRNGKDGDDEDFQQFKKHFCSNAKLRGFADVTTYERPIDPLLQEDQQNRSTRTAYYILTGLGVGNLNIWRFVEPEQYHQDPTWEHLQTFVTGGNTAMLAAFLPSRVSPGVITIAASCRDKNLRVWPMEYTSASSSSGEKTSNEQITQEHDTSFLGGVHTVNTHFSIQNTTDVVAIHGQCVYGISLMGDAYRFCFPDSTNLNSRSCEQLPRQVFELEKLGGGGNSKSRRSNIMLESLAASDDGKTLVAVSSEGIFYYSNKLPDVGSDETADLRVIGKNASENMLFKAPMKVYTPIITMKKNKVESEAMMAIVTNPSGEDSEKQSGYINVDPTETFAARWMVPSRGQNCWVCEVRNVCHWVGPPELKVKESNRAQLAAEQNKRTKAQRQRERTLNKACGAAVQHLKGSSERVSENEVAKTKARPQLSAKKTAQKLRFDNTNCGSEAVRSSSRGMSKSSGAGGDDDEENTGSDEDAFTTVSLMSELKHFQRRNAEIKTEWQRRLQGERQLRRKWKQREEEFLSQLNESFTKLDAAEVEVARLRVLLRDAEKRFAFEKVRVEQENSIKSRYEQLCEHMNDKMALVADQKRLLEQTTRSLLAEVDRNVHALKSAVVLEKSECVICKDQQAVTAVVPCGHLCFCEKDAEAYRHNCTTEYPTCPICQQEIVSMLRIYT